MISNLELHYNLSYIVERVRDSEPFALPHFEVMFLLGCRASESFNKSLWRKTSEFIYELSPLKGNNRRFFHTQDVPDSFKFYLENDRAVSYSLNYNKLSYLFKQLSLYRSIYVGEKQSTLHLFRHNYVKILLANHFTNEEIQHRLGEKNLKSAMAYISSEFSSKPFTLPVYE